LFFKTKTKRRGAWSSQKKAALPSTSWLGVFSAAQLLGAVIVVLPRAGISLFRIRSSSKLFILVALAHLLSVILTNASVGFGSLSGTHLNLVLHRYQPELELDLLFYGLFL
jgi:hypothetical protein